MYHSLALQYISTLFFSNFSRNRSGEMKNSSSSGSSSYRKCGNVFYTGIVHAQYHIITTPSLLFLLFNTFFFYCFIQNKEIPKPFLSSHIALYWGWIYGKLLPRDIEFRSSYGGVKLLYQSEANSREVALSFEGSRSSSYWGFELSWFSTVLQNESEHFRCRLVAFGGLYVQTRLENGHLSCLSTIAKFLKYRHLT